MVPSPIHYRRKDSSTDHPVRGHGPQPSGQPRLTENKPTVFSNWHLARLCTHRGGPGRHYQNCGDRSPFDAVTLTSSFQPCLGVRGAAGHSLLQMLGFQCPPVVAKQCPPTGPQPQVTRACLPKWGPLWATKGTDPALPGNTTGQGAITQRQHSLCLGGQVPQDAWA